MSTLTKLLSAAAALGMLAVLPGAAQAATIQLNTSALWADSGVSYHACNFTNVSNAAVSVKIYVIKSGGTVHTSTGATAVSVPARQTYELATAADLSDFAWCKFVTTAPASSVRANITVFRWTGTFYDSLATAEAR